MLGAIQGLFVTLVHCIKTATVLDAFEIVIIAFLIYKFLRLIHNTTVGRVARGIVMLLVIMQLSVWLQLNVISFILRNTVQIGLIALLIVFQPEIRKVLEQVGTGKLKTFFEKGKNADSLEPVIAEIADACAAMSRSYTGALIVFQRSNALAGVVTAATTLDAHVTSELVKNIFFKNTPLHDGAMIIIGDRIAYAGCVLPLSENNALSRDLGTRHRASIGITEKTDAVSLVVSEETGAISVAVNGVLTRNLDEDSLKRMLSELLSAHDPQLPFAGSRRISALWKKVVK